MNISPLPLRDAFIIETSPSQDNRGKFARFFCQRELNEINKGQIILQINFSMTNRKGTIRGMHFQFPPKAEVKMVRCLKGEIFDVAIDLRQDSPTFLKWHGEILSEKNMKMLYIPKGFAHGYQTLKNDCELLYLHTEYYSPENEGGIRFDDPKIGIHWPLKLSEFSNKDLGYPNITNEFIGIKI